MPWEPWLCSCLTLAAGIRSWPCEEGKGGVGRCQVCCGSGAPQPAGRLACSAVLHGAALGIISALPHGHVSALPGAIASRTPCLAPTVVSAITVAS